MSPSNAVRKRVRTLKHGGEQSSTVMKAKAQAFGAELKKIDRFDDGLNLK